MGESDCIFCKIVRGDIPSYKVYEDNETFAFLDINPIVKAHTIIIPKNHSSDITTIGEDDLVAVSKTFKKLALRYKDVLAADGFNLVNNNGEAAQQDIAHLHLHLIPRFKDDGVDMSAKQPKPPTQDIESVHKELTA